MLPYAPQPCPVPSSTFSLFDLLSIGGCIESEQLRVRRTGAAPELVEEKRVPELVEENQCGGGSLMPYVPQSLPRAHKIPILDKNGINPFSKAPIRHCRWETGNKETVWYFYGPSRRRGELLGAVEEAEDGEELILEDRILEQGSPYAVLSSGSEAMRLSID
uniref:Uncharacterized protein n=1 Tax=Oryza nivara TaxID=4536 RepID=A0A0E0HCB0_ORYNI